MRKAYVVMRKAVLQGQEGAECVGVYLDRSKADGWVAAQAGEFFHPSDYFVVETELRE